MSSESIDNKSKRLPSICVRVTVEEMKILEKMSETTGNSIPDILRKNTLARKELMQPLLTREQANEIFVALSRIGNNLNQVTKKINSGLMSGWSQSFSLFCRQIEELKHRFALNGVC